MNKFSYLLLALTLTGCAAFQGITNPMRSPDNQNCMDMNSFKVFQVLELGALAYENNGDMSSILDRVVYLRLHPNFDYYDGMIVDVPSGMCAVQDGVYKYETKGGNNKTVPVIDFDYMYEATSEEEKQERFEQMLDVGKYRIFNLCRNVSKTKDSKKKCSCFTNTYTDLILEMKKDENTTYEKSRSKIIQKVEKKMRNYSQRVER